MKSHKNDSHETRLVLLEHIAQESNETFKRIDQTLNNLTIKMDDNFKILTKKMDDNFCFLISKIDSNFKWIISTILLLFTSPLLIDLIKLIKLKLG